jgi:hypothetical protein
VKELGTLLYTLLPLTIETNQISGLNVNFEPVDDISMFYQIVQGFHHEQLSRAEKGESHVPYPH